MNPVMAQAVAAPGRPLCVAVVWPDCAVLCWCCAVLCCAVLCV